MYIGNQPTSQAFVTDYFNGDATTVAFTMTVAPANTSSMLVTVSGVLQSPNTYSINATTLTFSAAPPTGTGNISVRYLGIPASGVTTTAYRTVTEFTATASQTTFTPPSYTVGYINVYQNGSLLGSADYTATNGTTVVLAVGATIGDLVVVESFYVSSVVNAIPAVAGAVGSTYLAADSVIASKIATGAALSSMSANSITPNYLSTQSQYTGFKNRIINGAMAIDQRNAGASVTSSGLVYTLDRWLLQAVGATNSVQQVTGTGNNKAARITGNTSNVLTGFSQKIESVNISDLAGQSVTISFTLSGSTSGSVSVRRLYPTAVDNYTSTTEPDAGVSVSFTTTPTRYSTTVTLSANASNGLWLYFDFAAVGSGVTRTIENVQLEYGATATSFDVRPYGTELMLCQRYCNVYGGTSIYETVGYGAAISTGSVDVMVPFPVQMRAAPTLSASGSFQLSDGVTASVIFVLSLISVQTGTKQANLNATSSGLTTYRPYRIENANNTTARIILSAEL
jgi:hypothetical protein